MGSEDGGGTGYGVSVQSVLKLSDFYSVAKSSTRENNRTMLGSPQYTVAERDAYTLQDGSTVTLIYDAKGVLSDSLYTEQESGKSYSLFDKLALLGVLKSGSGGTSSAGAVTTDGQSGGSQSETSEGAPTGVFSKATYKRAAFDEALSLYLDRPTVLSTFGLPTGFTSRNYKKDSYILDTYLLEDGSMLLLDYGYDRKSLRAAAVKATDGTVSTYLGTWSGQAKPADFIRPTVTINQATSLSKGMTPEKVYEKIGEPMWFEGNAASYRDAYALSDGSVVYLEYENNHSKLLSAYRAAADGKQTAVTLK